MYKYNSTLDISDIKKCTEIDMFASKFWQVPQNYSALAETFGKYTVMFVLACFADCHFIDRTANLF